MADIFSDSDGEKAVEEVLSQAMDATVLEQVAAINCAGFTDSGLPSHLETRFRRLKSFPSATAKPTSLSTKSFSLAHPHEFKKSDSASEAKISDSVEGKNEGGKIEEGFCPYSKKIPESKNRSSPSKSSDSGSLSPVKKNRQVKMEKKGRKSPSSASWDVLSSRSVSPPAKSGCFLCSPKKVSRKKNKENRGLDLGLDWGKHDELLTDLNNFSVHSQKKMTKKAMKEEERICREADKIVKWAKQASARMDVSGIDDDLSDDDNVKFS